MMKYIKILIVIFSFFIAVLVTTLMTSFGTQAIFHFAKKLSSALNYQMVKGNFYKGVEISNFQLNLNEVSIKSNKINFKIKLLDLFRAKIHIANLTISDSVIYLNNDYESKKSKGYIPVAIEINNFNSNNMEINFNEKRLVFKKLKSYIFLYKNNLLIKNLIGMSDKINLYGNIDLNEIFYNVRLMVRNFNPDFIDPNFHGDLNFNVILDNSKKNVNYTQFILDSLNGYLNKLKINGKIDLKKENKKVTINSFIVKWADSSFKLAGYIDQNINIIWDITMPNIATLIPASTGRIISHGNITGPNVSPTINANALINNFLFENISVKNFEANLFVNTNLTEKSHAILKADDLSFHKFFIHSFIINFLGTLNQHDFKINFINNFHNILIKAHGSYANKKWLCQINNVNWLWNKLLFALNRTSNLNIGVDNLNLQDTCLTNKNMSLCLGMNWKKNQLFDLKTSLKKIPLANFFSPWLEKENNLVSIDGFIDGIINFHSDNKNISGTSNIKISPSNIKFDFNDNTEEFKLHDGEIKSKLDKDIFFTEGKLNFINQHYINFDFKLPNIIHNISNIYDTVIQGNINVNINDLSFISLLIHHLDDIKGSLLGKIKISGTLKKLNVIGNAKVVHATAELPSLNLFLKNINLNASGDQNGRLHYEGSFISGPGTVVLHGQTLINHPGFLTEIIFNGKNILLADTEHYKIIGNPNAQFHYLHKEMSVNGNVYIPSAKIKSDELRPETYEASNDIVIVDAGKPVPFRTPFNFTSKLNIQLGDDVEFYVRGASGKLAGHLFLNFNPQSLSTGNGEILIRNGKYTFYGQNLEIDKGRLTYTGGVIENPGLDIEAIRRVNSTNVFGNASILNGISSSMFAPPGQSKVGVKITGSYRNYQVNLFADPPIYNQNDILSLLIFGQVTDNVSGSNNRNMLLNAASSLNLGGSQISSITQKIQNTFGFEEFGIENQTSFDPTKQTMVQNTAFVVGRRIGQRLYLSYSIGLLNPTSVVKIRFDLAKGFYIQSENSIVAHGGDIFYSFEK